MKRLYFAASVALTTILMNTSAPAESAGKYAPAPRGKSLSERIAVSAKTVATKTRTVGLCYRGVKKALRTVGVALHGASAYMAKGQLESNDMFKKVPIDSVKRGDVIVHARSSAHPHGHIAVYLGNNREASDHVGKFIRKGRYGGATVFRPLETNFAASTTLAARPSAPAVAVRATVPPVVMAAVPTAAVAAVPAAAVAAVSTAKKDFAPATYQPPTLLATFTTASTEASAVTEKSVQEMAFERAVAIAKKTIDEQARLAEAFNHALSVARPLPPAKVDGTLAGHLGPSGSI